MGKWEYMWWVRLHFGRLGLSPDHLARNPEETSTMYVSGGLKFMHQLSAVPLTEVKELALEIPRRIKDKVLLSDGQVADTDTQGFQPLWQFKAIWTSNNSRARTMFSSHSPVKRVSNL